MFNFEFPMLACWEDDSHDILIFTFFRAAPKSVKVKFELRRGGEKNKSGRALRKCGRHICSNGQTAKVLRVFHLRQKTG